jgi:hypothetical protein
MFVELESELSGRLGRGVIVDLSATGFGLEAEAELGEGAVYDCHIEMPITVRAKVMRRYMDGQVMRYGMKIVNQTFLDKILLKKIIKGTRHSRKI